MDGRRQWRPWRRTYWVSSLFVYCPLCSQVGRTFRLQQHVIWACSSNPSWNALSSVVSTSQMRSRSVPCVTTCLLVCTTKAGRIRASGWSFWRAAVGAEASMTVMSGMSIKKSSWHQSSIQSESKARTSSVRIPKWTQTTGTTTSCWYLTVRVICGSVTLRGMMKSRRTLLEAGPSRKTLVTISSPFEVRRCSEQ